MVNSEKSSDDFKLRKNEIIRGYNSFNFILQNSKVESTRYLKAFISKQNTETQISENSKSPLFTGNVKVGFIIAKKKIRKAINRNRAKRLLRESYRLTKMQTGLYSLKLNLIFSLTDNGYALIKNNPDVRLNTIKDEMVLLSSNIKLKYSSL